MFGLLPKVKLESFVFVKNVHPVEDTGETDCKENPGSTWTGEKRAQGQGDLLGECSDAFWVRIVALASEQQPPGC